MKKYSMTAFIILAIGASAARSQGTSGTQWQRTPWTVGLYWVVESPFLKEMPSLDRTRERTKAGRYLTRFEVEKVGPEAGVMSGPLVRLRVSWIVEGQFDFEDQQNVFFIYASPVDGNIAGIEHWAWLDGELALVNHARISRPNRRPVDWPFQADTLPDTFHFMWPLFSGSPGTGLQLKDVQLTGPGGFSQQVVETLADQSSVTFSLPSGLVVSGFDPSLKLVFRDGLPWYEVIVVEDDGTETLVNRVVEVGQATSE